MVNLNSTKHCERYIYCSNVYIALDKMLFVFFNPKVLIFFLFLHKNVLWLELPQQGTSNEYPQHINPSPAEPGYTLSLQTL